MPFGFGPNQQAKLARILARLESPFENERAIAGLLATDFLAKHGLTWADLTGLASSAIPPAVVAEPAEIKAKRRRRRTGCGNWIGYCRRARRPIHRALDVLA